MTTLAQMIVDQGDAVDPKLAEVRAALCPPFARNHVVPSNRGALPSIAAAAEAGAMRFVFDQDAFGSAEQIMRTPESREIALNTARLPAPVVWFEWPRGDDSTRRDGALLRQEAWGWRIDFVVESRRGPFLFTVCAWRRDGREPEFLTSVRHGFSATDKDMALKCRLVVALCCILNVPGCSATEKVVVKSQFGRCRRLRRKVPLLSYNRVAIALPRQDESRPGARRSAEGPGVRWHRVIGHFRLCKKGQPEPVFVWVSSHARGDETQRVVLREVTVRSGGGYWTPARMAEAGHRIAEGAPL